MSRRLCKGTWQVVQIALSASLVLYLDTWTGDMKIRHIGGPIQITYKGEEYRGTANVLRDGGTVSGQVTSEDEGM